MAVVANDIQCLDLRKDREGGLERLARELTRIALDSRGGFDWDRARPPFPGLLTYDEGDAAVYFGRDDDIRRLIERLNARRAQGGTKLVALLGASGSGKSSLMRAGVTRDNRSSWSQNAKRVFF
jgi:predicted AAA+ superfamily ATPase